MKLRCIIIDDEPLAVDLLKSYAEQTPFLELVATFNSALLAIDTIRSEEIQLVFLDINMPKIDGLEFSKTLPATLRVVFTTAYDQYAIEGFRLNALDYLLKPISYTDFLKAAQRALDWFALVDSENRQNTAIFVKSGYQVKKIELDSILYIENQKDYVEFHLEGNAEPITSLMTLQSLEAKLPQESFIRTHRSFIVNLNKIEVVERNTIVFGKKYIPVSETYREQLQHFLDQHTL